MRKKWLIVGGVGLVILALLASTLFFSRSQGDACEKFLKSALENKADTSYGLLADSVKAKISESQWRDKVAAYYLQYSSLDTTYKLERSTTNTDPDGGPSTTTEEYLITRTVGKVRGTCTLDSDGKIKAYADEVVYE